MDDSVKVSGGILVTRSKSGTTKLQKVLVHVKRGDRKNMVKCRLQKFKEKRRTSKIPVLVKGYKRKRRRIVISILTSSGHCSEIKCKRCANKRVGESSKAKVQKKEKKEVTESEELTKSKVLKVKNEPIETQLEIKALKIPQLGTDPEIRELKEHIIYSSATVLIPCEKMTHNPDPCCLHRAASEDSDIVVQEIKKVEAHPLLTTPSQLNIFQPVEEVVEKKANENVQQAAKDDSDKRREDDGDSDRGSTQEQGKRHRHSKGMSETDSISTGGDDDDDDIELEGGDVFVRPKFLDSGLRPLRSNESRLYIDRSLHDSVTQLNDLFPTAEKVQQPVKDDPDRHLGKRKDEKKHPSKKKKELRPHTSTVENAGDERKEDVGFKGSKELDHPQILDSGPDIDDTLHFSTQEPEEIVEEKVDDNVQPAAKDDFDHDLDRGKQDGDSTQDPKVMTDTKTIALAEDQRKEDTRLEKSGEFNRSQFPDSELRPLKLNESLHANDSQHNLFEPVEEVIEKKVDDNVQQAARDDSDHALDRRMRDDDDDRDRSGTQKHPLSRKKRHRHQKTTAETETLTIADEERDYIESQEFDVAKFIDSGLRPLRSNESRLYIDDSLHVSITHTTTTPEDDGISPLLQDIPSKIFHQRRHHKKKPEEAGDIVHPQHHHHPPAEEPEDELTLLSGMSSATILTEGTGFDEEEELLSELKEYEDVTFKIEGGDKKKDFCFHIDDVPDGSYSSSTIEEVPKERKKRSIFRLLRDGDFCVHTVDPPGTTSYSESSRSSIDKGKKSEVQFTDSNLRLINLKKDRRSASFFTRSKTEDIWGGPPSRILIPSDRSHTSKLKISDSVKFKKTEVRNLEQSQQSNVKQKTAQIAYAPKPQILSEKVKNVRVDEGIKKKEVRRIHAKPLPKSTTSTSKSALSSSPSTSPIKSLLLASNKDKRRLKTRDNYESTTSLRSSSSLSGALLTSNKERRRTKSKLNARKN